MRSIGSEGDRNQRCDYNKGAERCETKIFPLALEKA